jgi:anti-sigma regulatory factor (Ser/Thr protein kinase)
MNIIQHAYRGQDDGQFMLEVGRTKQALCFRLEDYAKPVDLESIRPRNLDDIRPGGLGVHFIREIMDSYHMGHLADARGNFLEMTKNIE